MQEIILRIILIVVSIYRELQFSNGLSQMSNLCLSLPTLQIGGKWYFHSDFRYWVDQLLV